MTGTDGQIQYTRDISSGRIHKRSVVNGALQSFEADNADTSGEAEIVDETALDTAEPDDLCVRCFPDKQDGQAE